MLIQARTIFPLTSISQAPQLPPKHPVGIETPARHAAFNQSSPMVPVVVVPLGQCIGMLLIELRSGLDSMATRQPLSGVSPLCAPSIAIRSFQFEVFEIDLCDEVFWLFVSAGDDHCCLEHVAYKQRVG